MCWITCRPERREALVVFVTDKSLPIEEIAGRLGCTAPVAKELLRRSADVASRRCMCKRLMAVTSCDSC